MARRRSRRKSVHLPRAKPSQEFLAHGPDENERCRTRIAAAGEAVARSGKWPTLDKVERQDRKIAPATLGRNSDALDPARRIWMALAGKALVTSGEFPTLKAVQKRAGAVRLKDLARVEDALLDLRREWVDAHGRHPEWIDPADLPATTTAAEESGSAPMQGDPTAGNAVGDVRDDGAAMAVTNVDTSLLQRRLERLLAERKKDRETIAKLTEDLAEAQEAMRRALLDVVKDHEAYLNDQPAPKPGPRGRTRRPPK